MISILINHLRTVRQVSLEYNMQLSTYFLAVRLLDRVLLQLPIKKTKFQLLGCACLMIAGKLEEIEVRGQRLPAFMAFSVRENPLLITKWMNRLLVLLPCIYRRPR